MKILTRVWKMSILGRSSVLVPHGHSALCVLAQTFCWHAICPCSVPHPSVHNPICPGVKFMKIAGNSVDCLMGGAVRASSCHGNEMTLGHEFNLGCELTASFPPRFPWSLSLKERCRLHISFFRSPERRFSWKDLLALRGAERKDKGPSFRSSFHFFLSSPPDWCCRSAQCEGAKAQRLKYKVIVGKTRTN